MLTNNEDLAGVIAFRNLLFLKGAGSLFTVLLKFEKIGEAAISRSVNLVSKIINFGVRKELMSHEAFLLIIQAMKDAAATSLMEIIFLSTASILKKVTAV